MCCTIPCSKYGMRLETSDSDSFAFRLPVWENRHVTSRRNFLVDLTSCGKVKLSLCLGHIRHVSYRNHPTNLFLFFVCSSNMGLLVVLRSLDIEDHLFFRKTDWCAWDNYHECIRLGDINFPKQENVSLSFAINLLYISDRHILV